MVEHSRGAEGSQQTRVGVVIRVDLTLTTEHEIRIGNTVDHAHSTGGGKTNRRLNEIKLFMLSGNRTLPFSRSACSKP